jgi:prepilin-type N-terminal cleavage/methylation domain-containing protein
VADSADSGFTLIETLIAFLILSISLALVTQSIKQATGEMAGAERVLTAKALAERKLAEAIATSGRTEEEGGEAEKFKWRWARTSSPLAAARSELVLLDNITVEVWENGGEAPIFSLRTARLNQGSP